MVVCYAFRCECPASKAEQGMEGYVRKHVERLDARMMREVTYEHQECVSSRDFVEMTVHWRETDEKRPPVLLRKHKDLLRFLQVYLNCTEVSPHLAFVMSHIALGVLQRPIHLEGDGGRKQSIVIDL